MSIEVLSPGLLTTVQDLGRAGHTAIGVGYAGAMDNVAARLANWLVGNDETAACIEITLRGPRLRFDGDTVIAITGGEIDASLPMWRPLRIASGSIVDFGALRRGARTYVAIAGGIDVASVLGSRCTDVNAALGPLPRPLAVGDRLSTLSRLLRVTTSKTPTWSLDPTPWFDVYPERAIGVMHGTHFDRLDDAAQRALFASEFRIGSQSNRVGYRLEGPTLTLTTPLDMISEGTVPGTIQLPPDGKPIALMAEAPTTGGYPRIAHVSSVDLPRLAQRRPGDTVRFVEISIAEAQTRYLRRERELRALRTVISERLTQWLS